MSENKDFDSLDLMVKFSKTLPPEADWLVACNAMADLIDELRPLVNDEQIAMLVGLGAMMYRQGFNELKADFTTQSMMKKMRGES